VEDGKLVGVITTDDVLEALTHGMGHANSE
jgi:CBS domain-containing protein